MFEGMEEPLNANMTFKIRYLLDDRYSKTGGPILFYTGNEANIEIFYNTSGFQVETLAQ